MKQAKIWAAVLALYLTICIAHAANVTRIAPTTGSTAGNLLITVFGSAFSNSSELNTVQLVNAGGGFVSCNVTAAAFNGTWLTCWVPPSPFGPSANALMTVRVNVYPSLSWDTCRNITPCNFTYSTARTPAVTQLYPLSASAGMTLVISGANYAAGLSQIAGL